MVIRVGAVCLCACLSVGRSYLRRKAELAVRHRQFALGFVGNACVQCRLEHTKAHETCTRAFLYTLSHTTHLRRQRLCPQTHVLRVVGARMVHLRRRDSSEPSRHNPEVRMCGCAQVHSACACARVRTACICGRRYELCRNTKSTQQDKQTAWQLDAIAESLSSFAALPDRLEFMSGCSKPSLGLQRAHHGNFANSGASESD